jgi:hypothetical protein
MDVPSASDIDLERISSAFARLFPGAQAAQPSIPAKPILKRYISSHRAFTPPDRTVRLAESYNHQSSGVGAVHVDNDSTGLYDGFYLEEDGAIVWEKRKRAVITEKEHHEEDRFSNAPADESPELKAFGFVMDVPKK